MQTENSLEIVRKITKTVPSFHHHYHILYDLANTIEKEKITYLEIGAYGGASAILMLHNEKVEKVFSIDIGHPIKEKAVLKNVSDFFKDDRYNYIVGDSANNKVKESLLSKTKEVDILFIDGNHEYKYVLKDFENYSPVVSKGGFIVFDDYNCNICTEVKPAVNEIVKKINEEDFRIIGTLKNVCNAHPKEFEDGNCFIIQKVV